MRSRIEASSTQRDLKKGKGGIVDIELKAVAGATIPLVDPTYTPDGAASLVTDGTTYSNSDLLDEFPFMGHAMGGYQTVPGTSEA